MLRRTTNETIIGGCNYTSQVNKSLVQHAFILFNGTVLKISDMTSDIGERFGDIFTLPTITLSSQISTGQFACAIFFGSEVVSEESFLYNNPGILNSLFEVFFPLSVKGILGF